MSKLRFLFIWPLLLGEMVVGVVRHGLRWIRNTENLVHVINLLVIGASTYFLFGTIRLFMPNMPESIRLMITIIIGVLEYLALEHVATVLRTSERHGILPLDLGVFDRRFVAMTIVLMIAATLNIMGSYIDVHYRVAGAEATAQFEDHRAQDVHEAVLAQAYPELRAVQDALTRSAETYGAVEAMARRGVEQQDGEWADSFYGVGSGTGPRHEALTRIATAAGQQASAFRQHKSDLLEAIATLQNSYALSDDLVQRDVLRQREYDRIRTQYDALNIPGPQFTNEVQDAIRSIHTVPAGAEERIPALEDQAVLLITSRGLTEGPTISERDVSTRVAIGALSSHIRFAWFNLMRGGTEAFIAAGVALVLDGSVLLISMAWYAFFLLPYLVAILLRDLLGITVTSISRAVGTVFGRAAVLPSEVAIIGATEYREAWRSAREGWILRREKKGPPAEEVLAEVITTADMSRARRVIRVFARARFEPAVEALGGPGFVVEDIQLDGLTQDDGLVWNAVITELLASHTTPALLRLETNEGRVSYLFRPEVISSVKRLLDEIDRAQSEPGITDAVKKTWDRYREDLSGADA